MKLQLIVCVLVVSAGSLLADDGPMPIGPIPVGAVAPADGMPLGGPAPFLGSSLEQSVDAVVPVSAMARRGGPMAPPVVLGPDGSPAGAGYQPPLMAKPGPGCSTCGQTPAMRLPVTRLP